jgi:hypothetical protein
MRKLLPTLLCALLPAVAIAFPTELDVTGEVRVNAAIFNDGRVAIVRVLNQEAFAVRCQAVFNNGPEVSRSRRTVIEPGEEGSMSWLPRRNVVRLRVELSCAADD